MLKLSQLMDESHVALDVSASTVNDLLRALVRQLVVNGQLTEAAGETLSDALVRREMLGGTGVGRGVAVPHAYVSGVPEPIMVLARLEQPIPYGTPADGQPVDLVILLTGPESIRPQHARVLARIVRLMRDERWLAALRSADTSAAVIEAIHQVEARHV